MFLFTAFKQKVGGTVCERIPNSEFIFQMSPEAIVAFCYCQEARTPPKFLT